MIKIPFSQLQTTLDPSVIGLSGCAFARNVDVESGTLRRTLRHRRFQLPPLRTVETGGDVETPWFAPDSAFATPRDNNTSFFPPDCSPILVSDDTRVSCTPPLQGGKNTNLIWAFLDHPPYELPETMESLVLKVRVEHQIDPDTEAAGTIVLDLACLTFNDNQVGPSVGGQIVPENDSFVEFTFDLLSLGLTREDVASGGLGFKFGYAMPGYQNSDFTLTRSGTGKKRIGLPMSTTQLTGSPTWAVNAYDATDPRYAQVVGTAEVGVTSSLDIPSCVVEVRATATAGGGVPNYAGASYAKNGMGAVAATSNTLALADTTAKRKIQLTNGDGFLQFEFNAYTTENVPVPVDQGEIDGPINTFQTNDYQTSDLPPITNLPPIPRQAQMALTASVVQPDPATVRIDSVQFKLLYSTSDEVQIGGAYGLGYGNFEGSDEYQAIFGQGVFAVDAGTVANAANYDWSPELSGQMVEPGQWFHWQYANKIFAANPEGGVFYREIGGTEWSGQYKDVQSPGSTGDAGFAASYPPYQEVGVLDPVADTVGVTSMGTMGGLTPTIDPVTGRPWVALGDTGNNAKGGYLEFTITFGTSRDWSGAMAIMTHIQQGNRPIAVAGNDSFRARADSNQIILETNGGTVTAALPLIAKGPNMDVNQFGEHFGWVDLSGIPSAILSDVKKIKIRFGVIKTGRANYEISGLYLGATRYHDTNAWPFAEAATSGAKNDGDVKYAYRITEGSSISQAKTLVVATPQHLGARSFAGVPFGGGRVTVTVPRGDAPFTNAATIELYRGIGANWHKVSTAPNNDALVFEDKLPDSVIAANPGTYPITVLSFDPAPPSFSGITTGVICGCAWKGSNVYSGTDGLIYISRVGQFEEVLWEGVVLTNDGGESDIGAPRTSTLADNLTDYALSIVAAENLYCFTRREGYVIVSDNTPATSSLPRKIAGVRGVVGMRAACSFEDRVVFGSDDGLYAVKKSNEYGEQPDQLEEITGDIRPTWQWLLGSTPSTLVVREWRGELWCFNADRALRRVKSGQWQPIQWADGRLVNDAVSHPTRGLVLQAHDGSLLLIGDFVTDGGDDKDGTLGNTVTLYYRTGRWTDQIQPTRTRVSYEGAGPTTVSVTCESENGADTVDLSGTPPKAVDKSFRRVTTARAPLGGVFGDFHIETQANTRVTAWWADVTPRNDTK